MTYDPWSDLASRTEITFGVTSLPAGDGWWMPDVPAIVLGKHLNRVQRRCVLAHELAHADHGVEETQCAGNGRGTARIARRRERDADRTAAVRLVALERLADALRWALDYAEVAEILDVTDHIARVRILNLTDEEKCRIERRLHDDTREIA